jgi:hypothetical protein
MVLERLVSFKDSIRNPWNIFYLSSIVSIVSFVISFIIFKQDVGLYSVILTTIGLIPFMTKLSLYEGRKANSIEKKGISDLLFFYSKDIKKIIKIATLMSIPFIIVALLLQNLEGTLLIILLYIGIFLLFSLTFLSFYKDIILAYVAMFSGITLVFSIIYLILPTEIAERSFQTQIDEIKAIRGYFWFENTFKTIFINNIGVLIISFLFSFIYGSGATLVLAWNASILATASSILAKNLGGFYNLPIALLTYMPHGSIEIVAYFLAAIAGGIASYHITKGGKLKELQDSVFLLALGIVFILFGALIEALTLIG